MAAASHATKDIFTHPHFPPQISLSYSRLDIHGSLLRPHAQTPSRRRRRRHDDNKKRGSPNGRAGPQDQDERGSPAGGGTEAVGSERLPRVALSPPKIPLDRTGRLIPDDEPGESSGSKPRRRRSRGSGRKRRHGTCARSQEMIGRDQKGGRVDWMVSPSPPGCLKGAAGVQALVGNPLGVTLVLCPPAVQGSVVRRGAASVAWRRARVRRSSTPSPWTRC